MLFSEKTALVTGASRGIGRAIALAFAKEGANVAVIYAGNSAAAGETVGELKALGVKARAWQCDVGDFAAAGAVCKEVIEEFGGVDILVNNAGIIRDGLILSMKEADFDAVVNTSLKGAFNMTKHLYSHMMKKRRGRIINMASVSGLMGNAGQANYAAAKAGVIALTKTTARELAGRGVTCNAIAPGFIRTDMTDKLTDKVKENTIAAIPMKRMGEPEDIAAAAVFLASDAAGYITGEVLRVDGGLCI